MNWKMYFQGLTPVALLFGLFMLSVGCVPMHTNKPTLPDICEVVVIADLAYDANPHLGYTVFISEGGEYVPYLVLTNDYNGHTLLLRKYLLDELMRYNPPQGTGGTASFYGTSELGRFLNREFFYLFSDSLQNKIVNSAIEITSMDSLRALNDNVLEIVERRVFLLSREETQGRPHRRFMEEGNRLDYFHSQERRIAYKRDTTAEAWWIRTPATIGTPDEPGVISFDGTHGTVHLFTFDYTRLGVRPAFCLPSDTHIHQGELGGDTVFFIGE